MTKKEFRHFRHIRVHYRLHARITSCRNHDRHVCLQSYKQNQQEALLLQRDCARHLSVEILQLQNISLENPIV